MHVSGQHQTTYQILCDSGTKVDQIRALFCYSVASNLKSPRRRLRIITTTLVLAITTRMLVDVAVALVVIHVTDSGGVLLYHWRFLSDRLNTDAQRRPVNN